MNDSSIVRAGVAQFCLIVILFSLTGCGGSSSSNSTPGTDNASQEPRATAPDDLRNPSVARIWNEVILEGIRGDLARPTVHARNLFHLSSAMYDAWALYAKQETPYLAGQTLNEFDCPLGDALPPPADLQAAREEAISYAAYRLIMHRFDGSRFDYLKREDVLTEIGKRATDLMVALGYDPVFEGRAYADGSAAALGNYIADCYRRYGLQDGANESSDYANLSYRSVNEPILPNEPGNPNLTDFNRWQPIAFSRFVDQSGNEFLSSPGFLSPEWGQVLPFSLQQEDATLYERDGFTYRVYHDPGLPAQLGGTLAAEYQWGFALVAVWSSHLDPDHGVMIDISPRSIGNIRQFPSQFEDYRSFYAIIDGGDAGQGYSVNPATGAPYEEQLVPRGDYARVLAEFWADGPDSETPPGHWFVILNSVNDHPQLSRKLQGQGAELGYLEWDVKAYFALGGAMHDAAIAAWGIKGWYDYVRPLSAIRGMADLGQSSDAGLDSYHAEGLPLIDGFIELVEAGDPLAGGGDQHVGKLKLLAWRGPDQIGDPETDMAGVGWILAENWWPYQRPTFITPPFAGYVSGHSTFSRAAAEVLTAFTGDPFFPGGQSGFNVRKNEFLVFEDGPSVDMTLQWATYRDASDQCSLSRIWGGIHPPVDDIPGRLIGEKIGVAAIERATAYFSGEQ